MTKKGPKHRRQAWRPITRRTTKGRNAIKMSRTTAKQLESESGVIAFYFQWDDFDAASDNEDRE